MFVSVSDIFHTENLIRRVNLPLFKFQGTSVRCNLLLATVIHLGSLKNEACYKEKSNALVCSILKLMYPREIFLSTTSNANEKNMQAWTAESLSIFF